MHPFEFNLLKKNLKVNPIATLDLYELFPDEVHLFIKDYPHFCRRFIGVFSGYLILDLNAVKGRNEFVGLKFAYDEIVEENLSPMVLIKLRPNIYTHSNVDSLFGINYLSLSETINEYIEYKEGGTYLKYLPYSIVPQEIVTHKREIALRELILSPNLYYHDDLEAVYIYSTNKGTDKNYLLIKSKFWNELTKEEQLQIEDIINEEKYKELISTPTSVDNWYFKNAGSYNRYFKKGRMGLRIKYRNIVEAYNSHRNNNSGSLEALYLCQKTNAEFMPKIYAVCGSFMFMEHIDGLRTLEDMQYSHNYKKVMKNFKQWYLKFAEQYEKWRVEPVDEHSNNIGYSKEKGWFIFDFDDWNFSSNRRLETPEQRYVRAKFNSRD